MQVGDDLRGRRGEPVEQAEQGRLGMGVRTAGHGGDRPVGEEEEVVAFVAAESQRPCERGQHLRGGLHVASAFEFGVVVGRQAGQLRDLLTPQSGDPAPGPGGQSHVGGPHAVAPGPQKRGEFGKVHPPIITRGAQAEPGDADPRVDAGLAVRAAAGEGGPQRRAGSAVSIRTNFKVPAGTLTGEQKEQIITRTTELYVDIYGERARATTLAELRRTAGSRPFSREGKSGRRPRWWSCHRPYPPHPSPAQPPPPVAGCPTDLPRTPR